MKFSFKKFIFQNCAIRSQFVERLYLPFPVMYRNCIFVNLINLTVPLRTIFIDEKINIVHGHGSFSTMAQECMISANMLNLGMVFTEHSLHGFSDLGSFALNGIWKLTCGPCDNVLAVSNCQLLNVKHRLSSPDDNTLKFQTLPNSIYPELYKPPEFEHPDAKNTIIVVSRLTGRKGALLMVKTLEQVLNIYREVFLKCQIEERFEGRGGKCHMRSLLGSNDAIFAISMTFFETPCTLK